MIYEEKTLKLKLLKTNEILDYNFYFMRRHKKNEKNENFKKSFIYCWILDNLDGTYTPMYVGQTIQGNKRWIQERTKILVNSLYKAIKNYKEKLQPYVIEFINNFEEFNDKELFYYKLFNTDEFYGGLNIKMPLCNRSVKKVDYVIAQYDIDGNLLNIYSSLKQASLNTKGHRDHINQCVKGNYFHSKDFIWRKYLIGEEIPKNIIIVNNSKTGKYGGKKVYQYSLNYELINEYKGCREAARQLLIPNSFSQIAASARSNGEKIFYNYRWSYEKI